MGIECFFGGDVAFSDSNGVDQSLIGSNIESEEVGPTLEALNCCTRGGGARGRPARCPPAYHEGRMRIGRALPSRESRAGLDLSGAPDGVPGSLPPLRALPLGNRLEVSPSLRGDHCYNQCRYSRSKGEPQFVIWKNTRQAWSRPKINLIIGAGRGAFSRIPGIYSKVLGLWRVWLIRLNTRTRWNLTVGELKQSRVIPRA